MEHEDLMEMNESENVVMERRFVEASKPGFGDLQIYI